MKYQLDIAPRVNKEVAAIYLYREKTQGKGSGPGFLKALNECYDRILANPYGYQIRKDPFRHVMLHRLKYRLAYKVGHRHERRTLAPVEGINPTNVGLRPRAGSAVSFSPQPGVPYA